MASVKGKNINIVRERERERAEDRGKKGREIGDVWCVRNWKMIDGLELGVSDNFNIFIFIYIYVMFFFLSSLLISIAVN